MSEYIGEYVVSLTAKTFTDLRSHRHEQIVRCRDCKHARHESNWQPDKRRKPIDLWLCEAEWCEGLEGDSPCVKPDGFCAWGERKDDE